MANTESGWGNPRRFIRTWNGDEFDKLSQVIRRSPFMQVRNVIRPDQIKQFGFWEAAGVVPNGVNGVGSPAAFNFLFVDLIAGFAGECEAEQPESNFRCGRFGFRLEGRL